MSAGQNGLCAFAHHVANDARSHRPVYRSEFSVFPPLNYTKYQFSIVIAIFNEWEKNVGCSHVGVLCRDKSGANVSDPAIDLSDLLLSFAYPANVFASSLCAADDP